MATFGKKVAPLEKRIGEDSNQNKTFGKKVANVGKVGHNLCKKGCLQPLQKKGCLQPLKKRLWQMANCLWKNKHLENKRVCYISFDGRNMQPTAIGKNDIWYSLWRKDILFQNRQPVTEPLAKRYLHAFATGWAFEKKVWQGINQPRTAQQI